MSRYALNGNPWGGSFILEGSTDGTSWDVMVAKSANNTFLGREGLSTAGGNISSGYNSTVFTNTNFSIYKPDNTYFPPDRVSNATYPGTLKQYSTTTGCKVTLSRVGSGNWDKISNTKEDFSVNCFLSTGSPWTAGTVFNCVVTNYNSGNGELTFDTTPTISGTFKFAIIVRSGQGTGITSNILQTSATVTIEQPTIQFIFPSLLRQAAKQTGQGRGACVYDQTVAYAGATSGLFYPYHCTGDYDPNTPFYVHLGMIDTAGQRVLHPQQVSGSKFVTQGLVPASILVNGTMMANFPGKQAMFASSGFAINKVMSGDFTLVIKSDGNYPVCSMAFRQEPFNPYIACSFWNFTRFAWQTYGHPWGWDGQISGTSLTKLGAYNPGGKTTVSNVWYEYKRVGNNLSINYGSVFGTYGSTFCTGTCSTGDHVGCFYGAAGGEGTSIEIVSFTGTTVTTPITFTYTYTSPVYTNTITSFAITVSPLSAITDLSPNIKVYYSESNTDPSPTLCSSDSGTAVNVNGESNVSCTFSSIGIFYLYIRLSIDSYNLLSPSSSTITVTSQLERVVLLSRSTRSRNWIIPEIYVDQTTARTFYDLTLGGGVSTYGYIAKFRDNSDSNLIYSSSMISYIGNEVSAESQYFFPSQMLNNAQKQFDWIRWGYTSRVRPYNFHWSCGSYPEWQSGVNLELWGYTSKDFVTGATMLVSVSPETRQTDALSTIAYAFTGGTGNTRGWSHYEIKNTSSASATWAWAVGMHLQK